MRRRRATGAAVSPAAGCTLGLTDRKLPGVSATIGALAPAESSSASPCRPLAADGAATARPPWARTASTPIPPVTASPRRRRSGRPDLSSTPTARTATWPRASTRSEATRSAIPALDPAYHGLSRRRARAHPGRRARPVRAGRDAGRRAAAPARDLRGPDRVPDRAPLGPSPAALAARGDRVAAPTRSPCRPTSGATSSTGCCASRRSSTTSTARSSARSSSRSRAST